MAAQLGHTDAGKLIHELYGHGDVGALERIDAALGNVVSADFSGRVEHEVCAGTAKAPFQALYVRPD